MSNRTGYITISYGVNGERDPNNMTRVVLVVSQDTMIIDENGRRMTFRDIEKGMYVDAIFSAIMTRSIPPQSRAYRITILNRRADTDVTVGRVMDVDIRNSFFYTGDPEDIFTQMRFAVPNGTPIIGANGQRLSLRDLRAGQMVRVEHATFQTSSIPPQTTAVRVIVLS